MTCEIVKLHAGKQLMDLFIKNMVCNRCVMVVKDLLSKNGLTIKSVQLGEAVVAEELSAAQLEHLSTDLKSFGFELLDDSRKTLIEKIKTLIIRQVHYREDEGLKLSEYLSRNLHRDYSYLSRLFTEVEGITIEKFLINQKIEKAKELLVYDEKSLSQIAFDLGYSSVAHLSSQFSKVTGMTPSAFKKLGNSRRNSLDDIKKM